MLRLCRAVRETLDAERVIAWLYDAPAQTVTPYATDTPAELELLERWVDTPLDRLPFACTVLLESRAVEIEDAQDDERVPAELAADVGMSSVRVEPLLAGRPVGMLTIEPARAGARPELQSLAPMLAAGIGRLAGRSESDRGRREVEFLLELTRAASAAGSIDRVLATICERIAAEAGARRATIYVLDGGRLVPRASREADGSYDRADWTRIRAEAAPPLGEAALQSGKATIARDASSPMLPDRWRSLGAGSAVAVPLIGTERPVGVLLLDDPEPDRFSGDAARLAENAARQVAPVLEQSLESDERTSHLRAATAIRTLLEQGAGAVSVQEAGEVLARVTRDALGSERATLLLQDENDVIEHVVSVGADGDFERVLKERLGRTPARDFRIWRITTRQPKPVFVENARASRLIPPDLVEELEIQSYVAVPLLAATRPLGLVICSHTSAARTWTPEERQLVTQIALEGSLILDNANLRADERERLALLKQQAFHDSLTELPNRALFSDRLQHAIDRMTRRRQSIAVLFLDLDEFKPVNDTLGHDAGDRLLMAVGERLQTCLRPEDTIARLGGDEFTVLLEDITDVRYAIGVAERIAEAMRDPFDLDGNEVSVTTSIGIAVGGGNEANPEDLVRKADQAMYEAKRNGKARYSVFHERVEPETAPAEEAKAVEHADVVEEIAEEAVEDAVEIEIHREEPPPAQDAEGNGRPPETERKVASSLSEARRRRRQRFPPR